MVHPHACGELYGTAGSTSPTDGSSPRMWGTRLYRLTAGQMYRFIPTHVGNSSSIAISATGKSVHPHACGELYYALLGVGLVIGSSPRMWGTHPHRRPDPLARRFIPTHVGNSFGWAPTSRHATVHPHACGELLFGDTVTSINGGSSPRMWGTRPGHGDVSVWVRFIPTHVGNSAFRVFSPILWVVHPHACGELN